MPTISLVVPCYNEQDSLSVFFQETNSILQTICAEYEVIFVNDGSQDQTIQMIRELAQRDNHVKYLSFSRNFGKEAAIYAGLSRARGNYVAVIDADLQDPPSLLPKMLRILQTGEYDSVAARRVSRKGEPPLRSWFAHQFYRIINRVSETGLVDGERDFRLMRREMLDAVLSMSEYNRFSKGIFRWVGFRTYWLSYDYVERVAGKTGWSFWELCRYAVNGIINFSEMPLTMVSWLGVGFSGIAFLSLVFIVIRRLAFGDPVPGWASTICVIIFVGGIQLLSVGVLGQYIAKIYSEVKHRPIYIVSETNMEKTSSTT